MYTRRQCDRKPRKTTIVSVHWIADTPTQRGFMDLKADHPSYYWTRFILPEAQHAKTVRCCGLQEISQARRRENKPQHHLPEGKGLRVFMG